MATLIAPTPIEAPTPGVLAREATKPHDLLEFISRNGRFPWMSDAVKPWEYRGWLLLYVQEAHRRIADVPDRWGYFLETLEAGHLLNDPIPQMRFSEPDRAASAAIRKWVQLCEEEVGCWSGFLRFLDWLAWGLAVSKEPAPLSERLNEMLYAQVDITKFLLAPSDYLGNVLSDRKGGGRNWNPTGFYPTPHHVCEAMVLMTMLDNPLPDGRDSRTASVCDPAVGTGRLLLHASNYSLNLYGMDIDPTVVRICLINGALYAPWMAFTIPAAILGVDTPPPPPARLPLPGDHPLPDNVIPFRADDRGQGLLF